MDVRDVYGIGEKTAHQLKRYYGIRTIRALESYVRKIPDIISESQQIGLKYHQLISKRISRAEAEKHVAYILKNVRGAVIAGSYRRGEKTIGDIDFIVSTPLSKVVNHLIQTGYIVAVLGEGDEKFSGVANLNGSHRKVDIIYTTPAEKPFALLYFTGDYIQNIHMRRRAKTMGYSLSQHGLRNTKTNRLVPGIKSERDIFKFLKMDYVPPEERVHGGGPPTPLLR